MPAARVTWVCALFLLCYVGTEVSLGGWIVVFMIQIRGGEEFSSGMTATGFWLGLAIGRVILGFVTPRIGEKLAISVSEPSEVCRIPHVPIHLTCFVLDLSSPRRGTPTFVLAGSPIHRFCNRSRTSRFFPRTAFPCSYCGHVQTAASTLTGGRHWICCGVWWWWSSHPSLCRGCPRSSQGSTGLAAYYPGLLGCTVDPVVVSAEV